MCCGPLRAACPRGGGAAAGPCVTGAMRLACCAVESLRRARGSPDDRMKILFLMDSPEYLRFYDSAIEELALRGHAVAIAVNHSSHKKPVGLGGLQAYADRVSVSGVVPKVGGRWGRVAYGLRGTMDFVRYL